MRRKKIQVQYLKYIQYIPTRTVYYIIGISNCKTYNVFSVSQTNIEYQIIFIRFERDFRDKYVWIEYILGLFEKEILNYLKIDFVFRLFVTQLVKLGHRLNYLKLDVLNFNIWWLRAYHSIYSTTSEYFPLMMSLYYVCIRH